MSSRAIGHRPSIEYSLIMGTFLDVFPHATLWYDANFMVGTLKPLAIDPTALDRVREHPETRAALDAVGLDDSRICGAGSRPALTKCAHLSAMVRC